MPKGVFYGVHTSERNVRIVVCTPLYVSLKVHGYLYRYVMFYSFTRPVWASGWAVIVEHAWI